MPIVLKNRFTATGLHAFRKDRTPKVLTRLDGIELVISRDVDGRSAGAQCSDEIIHLEFLRTTAPPFQLD